MRLIQNSNHITEVVFSEICYIEIVNKFGKILFRNMLRVYLYFMMVNFVQFKFYLITMYNLDFQIKVEQSNGWLSVGCYLN